MKPLRRLLAVQAAVSLAVLSASAQDLKHAPTPHSMPDIKTPAPILPAKPPAPARTPIAPGSRPQGARVKLPAALSGAHPQAEPDALYFDQPGDGSTWAMGRTFKAQFDADGASYIPNFGHAAPRNFPLSLRLAGAEIGGTPIACERGIAAVRKGDELRYERGGLTEIYALRADSVEQEFVFTSLPGSGDLVVRMAVGGELTASVAGSGLRFSNELGSVEYGKAVAIDAQGRRADAQTLLDGQDLEIRVPAEFVAAAALPLTIDPVITTFSVDSGTTFDYSTDVAYDASSGRYLVCYEREYSSTDHDVWAQEYDANGTPVSGSGAYIDFTGNYWGEPRCASNNLAHNFLVVAQVGTGFPYTIWGRTRDAASVAMSAQIGISNEPSYNCYLPSVGGDPALLGPTYYLVAWSREYAAGDDDVHAQLVDPAATLTGGLILIDNSAATLDTEVHVSKSDGLAPYSTQRWTVTWTREFSPGVDYDIWGSQLSWDGTIAHPTYIVDYSTAYDYGSCASSLCDGAAGERDCLVIYARYNGATNDTDVHGALYNGTTYVTDANLSALDTSTVQNQISPTVDCDGAHYAVAYAEQYSTSTFDYDMYVSTFNRVGNTLRVTEAHQLLDFSGLQDAYPKITAAHSGGGSGARFLVSWQDLYSGFTDCDVSAGLYEAWAFTSFCQPGFDAIACPCGNPPSGGSRGCNNSSNTGGATLGATGQASVGADTVQFSASGEKPTATSVFLEGNSVNLAGTVFGQGVRCVSGTLKRLYVKTAAGGVATAPVAGDPSVSTRSAALGDALAGGSIRYYLVYYRDPTVLGGCSAASTFNATQTLAASWIP